MMEMEWDILRIADHDLPDAKSLPGALKTVALALDVRTALRLGKAFGGITLYIPGVQALENSLRNQCIRREYDGGTTGQRLAMKYRLSERQVWNILGEPDQAAAHDRQERMF